ncbi:MAG: amidohydrolase [Rhodospirillales bacterium]|nr:amidohydrolase [Rhodospirillales bacterium]
MSDTTNDPGYGRTAVETLIVGAIIITMDAARRIITDGALAISGDRIAAIGKRAEIEPLVDAKEIIDGRRFVITPGFVNGHIHTTETLIKGYIPENAGFEDGIWRWSVPLYELQTPAEQQLAGRLSALSMLRTGTTCFLEAGTVIALDEVFAALDETGIRGRIGQWVLDRAFSPDQDQTALTDRALRILEDELVRYPGGDGQRLSAWPLLIGHNTNTDALWRGAKQLADEHGAGISAHMSPAKVDPDWYLAHTGKRPVAHLADLGVLGENVSLTHMVHVDLTEVALLAETGTNVIHCPTAALKGGYGTTGLGLFPEMAAAGVTLMLGTDGADHTDMMRATTLMAGLFKDARQDAALFPAHQALEMATINGAKALGLTDQIGSLEVGRKADLVLHDTDRPEWKPLLNCIAQLVWSADGRGVHSVWVNGERLVDNYRCTTIDEERLYAEAQTAAKAITGRSGLSLVCPWPMI